MTKKLTQQELVLLTDAISIYHQEIVKEFETLSKDTETVLSFKVDKNSLAIKIAAKTDLDNAGLERHIKYIIENFFKNFINIENVKELFQIVINESKNPPSILLSNIQLPEELHQIFINRLKYKCSPILDKQTQKGNLKKILERKDVENLIRLLLSSPYLPKRANTLLISAYRELVSPTELTDDSEDEQLLFLFETLYRWKEKISRDKILSEQMRPFLRSIPTLLETLISNISSPLFSTIINKLSELIGTEKICDLWAQNYLLRLEHQSFPINIHKLLRIMKKLDVQTANKITTQLLLSAIKKRNLRLIRDIYTKFPEIYATVKNHPLHSQQTALKTFEYLNSIQDDTYKKFATTQMEQILAGFGHLDHDAGLLALASRNIFTPGKRDRDTIIISNDEKEIDYLFELLSKAPRPFRERFIVSGGHWTTYDVLINEAGKVFILMLDSLGGETVIDSAHLNTVKKNILESICRKNRFTDFEVFIGMEKRQYDFVSCQVFSLDDISHLYSVEDYLDPAVYPGGLFDYLKQNITQTIQIDGITIHLSQLPLHLIRNMHSRTLLEILKEERRGEHILSHRKEDTPARFLIERQGFFKCMTKNGNERELNLRLENKLKKMQDRCLQFLMCNDFYSIKHKMHKHTIEGLQNRLQPPSLASTGIMPTP